jgi:DNA-binding response OmpR family regulator
MGSNHEGIKFAENMNARLRSRKILHIDDDPQFTRLMQLELQSAGFQVDALNDERQWEETLLHGGYRVVLLDMEMPYISGGQVLRKIKQHDGAIQVIMLTGLVRMFVVLDSLRDGAEYCFFKPLVDTKPLVQAIEATFARIDHWRQTVAELRSSMLDLRASTSTPASVSAASPILTV